MFSVQNFVVQVAKFKACFVCENCAKNASMGLATSQANPIPMVFVQKDEWASHRSARRNLGKCTSTMTLAAWEQTYNNNKTPDVIHIYAGKVLF